MPPLYEFYCEHCDFEFESLMKPYEPVACPHCRTQGCKRMVSKPAGYEIKGDNSASTKPGAK